MDQIDRRSGRFHDGDRESKIRWDMTSKLHRDFDSFTPEMNRGIDGVRHHLRQNTHRVERDLPRRPPAWVCEGHSEEKYIVKEENKQFVRSKVPILSEFSSKENLLEWFHTVEGFFEEMQPPENLKCKLGYYALEGEAERWWQQLQHQRIMKGESKIKIWCRMKFLLINDFWPTICSTKCPLRVCNARLNEKCIFDQPDDFSYPSSFTMMKVTPKTENHVEKFEDIKEAEKQGFMSSRCSLNCLSQATTAAEVSMKFNKENKEEKSTEDIDEDGEYSEEAMNYNSHGYGASDGAEVECISSKNVKLWGPISEFGAAPTKEPVTQDTIHETKGIKMDSEDLKGALALVEGCAGDDDQIIDEEEDSGNGRSKENEEESIKVPPVASQFPISETSIREKPFMMEYSVGMQQTNVKNLGKKTLSSYPCFTNGHLVGYENQLEVKKVKLLSGPIMDTSTSLDYIKNSVCLTYGHYMVSCDSVLELALLLFDPGGTICPGRSKGSSMSIGISTELVLSLFSYAFKRTYDWNSDRVLRDKASRINRQPYNGFSLAHDQLKRLVELTCMLNNLMSKLILDMWNNRRLRRLWLIGFSVVVKPFSVDNMYFTSLIYGEYMTSTYLNAKLSSFLFDPGGSLYPMKDAGVRIEILDEYISVGNAQAPPANCKWSFDIKINDKNIVKDRLDISVPLDSLAMVNRFSICETMDYAIPNCNNEVGASVLSQMTIVAAYVDEKNVEPADTKPANDPELAFVTIEGISHSLLGSTCISKGDKGCEVYMSLIKGTIPLWRINVGMNYVAVISKSSIIHIFPSKSETKRADVWTKLIDSHVHQCWEEAAAVGIVQALKSVDRKTYDCYHNFLESVCVLMNLGPKTFESLRDLKGYGCCSAKMMEPQVDQLIPVNFYGLFSVYAVQFIEFWDAFKFRSALKELVLVEEPIVKMEMLASRGYIGLHMEYAHSRRELKEMIYLPKEMSMAGHQLGKNDDMFATLDQMLRKTVIFLLSHDWGYGFNLTRGRVIQWEGWHDENKSDTEGNKQSRESLTLFYKVVNGLDPPMILIVLVKLESGFLRVRSRTSFILFRGMD